MVTEITMSLPDSSNVVFDMDASTTTVGYLKNLFYLENSKYPKEKLRLFFKGCELVDDTQYLSTILSPSSHAVEPNSSLISISPLATTKAVLCECECTEAQIFVIVGIKPSERKTSWFELNPPTRPAISTQALENMIRSEWRLVDQERLRQRECPCCPPSFYEMNQRYAMEILALRANNFSNHRLPIPPFYRSRDHYRSDSESIDSWPSLSESPSEGFDAVGGQPRV